MCIQSVTNNYSTKANMTGYTLYIAAGTKNRAEICTSHIPRDIADLFYIDTFPRIVRAGYDTDFS